MTANKGFEELWQSFFDDVRMNNVRGFSLQFSNFENRIKPICLSHFNNRGMTYAAQFLATSIIAFLDVVVKSIASDIASLPESVMNPFRRKEMETEAMIAIRAHCGSEFSLRLFGSPGPSHNRFNLCKKLTLKGSIGNMEQMCSTCIGLVTDISIMKHLVHRLVIVTLDFQMWLTCMEMPFDVPMSLFPNEIIPDDYIPTTG
jgi:hypothetical protein